MATIGSTIGVAMATTVNIHQYTYLSLGVHDADGIALVADHKLVGEFGQVVDAVHGGISPDQCGLVSASTFSRFCTP